MVERIRMGQTEDLSHGLRVRHAGFRKGGTNLAVVILYSMFIAIVMFGG